MNPSRELLDRKDGLLAGAPLWPSLQGSRLRREANRVSCQPRWGSFSLMMRSGLARAASSRIFPKWCWPTSPPSSSSFCSLNSWLPKHQPRRKDFRACWLQAFLLDERFHGFDKSRGHRDGLFGGGKAVAQVTSTESGDACLAAQLGHVALVV